MEVMDSSSPLLHPVGWNEEDMAGIKDGLSVSSPENLNLH